MDIVIIERDTPEWDYMWQWLESHPINEGIKDPRVAVNGNEAWQYMGSARQDNKVISEFRHRCHPKNNKVVKLSVNHLNKLNDEDIAKVIKIK